MAAYLSERGKTTRLRGQAIAIIARITGGNFRLLHRLFVQIGRILKINELSITDHRRRGRGRVSV